MKRLLTDDEILDLFEANGFEFNDFGNWNCTSDDIFQVVDAIEEYYDVKGEHYAE